MSCPLHTTLLSERQQLKHVHQLAHLEAVGSSGPTSCPRGWLDPAPADHCHGAWIFRFLRESRKLDLSVGSFNRKLLDNSIKSKAKHNMTPHSPKRSAGGGWLQVVVAALGQAHCVVTGLRWAFPAALNRAVGLLMACGIIPELPVHFLGGDTEPWETTPMCQSQVLEASGFSAAQVICLADLQI